GILFLLSEKALTSFATSIQSDVILIIFNIF
ncbi:hypothetical protein A5875_000205, partial [Enterococcus sp. 3H8_DIV0648]